MTKAEKMRAELKRYNKLAKRNKVLNSLSKKREVSSAGVKYNVTSTPKTKKVNGETVGRQQMKGKQKQYRTSKPLI